MKYQAGRLGRILLVKLTPVYRYKHYSLKGNNYEDIS